MAIYTKKYGERVVITVNLTNEDSEPTNEPLLHYALYDVNSVVPIVGPIDISEASTSMGTYEFEFVLPRHYLYKDKVTLELSRYENNTILEVIDTYTINLAR